MNLTLEKLNALRGISSNANKSVEKNTANEQINTVSSQPVQSPESFQKNDIPGSAINNQPQTESSNKQLQGNNIQPVEIPCKNYMDAKGHFGYIDANTHQAMHVNLDSGQIYEKDDIYRLSLQHSVEALSPEYHQLTWQQVINNDTLFDMFGSPVFNFEEIQAAFDKYIKSTSPTDGNNTESQPKTDPFGFPLY